MNSEPRVLYRDPANGVFCGVCAGLAAYFKQDVILLRIIAITLLLLFSGVTFIVYIIMRLVLPIKPVSGRVIEHPTQPPQAKG
jgi:phage shock protein C